MKFFLLLTFHSLFFLMSCIVNSFVDSFLHSSGGSGWSQIVASFLSIGYVFWSDCWVSSSIRSWSSFISLCCLLSDVLCLNASEFSSHCFMRNSLFCFLSLSSLACWSLKSSSAFLLPLSSSSFFMVSISKILFLVPVSFAVVFLLFSSSLSN